MGILNQSLLSSFGPTTYYEVNGNGVDGSGYNGNGQAFNLDGYHAKLMSSIDTNYDVKYKTQIYYNDILIYDTGYSGSIKFGNAYSTPFSIGPKNWPPATTQYTTFTKTLDPGDDDDEQTVYAGAPLNNGTGSTAKKGAYLFPDIHHEAVKNGETFPNSNTSIENNLQGGSHFLIGDYKQRIKVTNYSQYDEDESPPYWGEQAPTVYTYYYELIKLSSPPPIYRNTIAIEDSSDNDFNDLLVCLKSGDGFFTGTVKPNSTAPIIKEYTYGGAGSGVDWTRFVQHSFVANTTGTYVFQVRRRASDTNRLLLHPGSGNPTTGNFAIIVPAGDYTHQDRSFTLNAGTYQVALTSDNDYNLSAHAHVRSIDVNYWPMIF
tara:strand:- start:96 stop:1220 length:1125 start_codon:yes stop_codon:yes gene_type:complete